MTAPKLATHKVDPGLNGLLRGCAVPYTVVSDTPEVATSQRSKELDPLRHVFNAEGGQLTADARPLQLAGCDLLTRLGVVTTFALGLIKRSQPPIYIHMLVLLQARERFFKVDGLDVDVGVRGVAELVQQLLQVAGEHPLDDGTRGILGFVYVKKLLMTSANPKKVPSKSLTLHLM